MVIAIWDKPDMSDATDVLKSIGALLPPPPPGTPGPFALSEDGKIEKVFANIDMKVVYKTRVACPFLFDSLSDGIKSFMGTGPAAAAMHHCSRQTVEQSIAKALEPFGLVDEFIFLQNHFLVFIAEK